MNETELAETLTEESGTAAVTEGLSWDIRDVLEQLGLTDLTGDFGEKLTLSHVWEVLSGYVMERVQRPFQLLGALLTVTLFAALVQALAQGNLSSRTHTAFQYLCALGAVSVLCTPLLNSFSLVEETLTQGAAFMMLFVPVFAGVLVASGTATGALCYQTAVTGLADGILQMIAKVLLPLCTMSFALAIVDGVSPSVSVGGLLRLIRKGVTWFLGLLMTLFLGVLSLETFVASSTDTAVTKTAKYLLSGAVPVVGSAVSDAYATVRSSLGVLSGATGVIGMVSLCLMFLPPLVQLLLYRLILAVAEAAAELCGTERLKKLFQGTSQALAIAFALLVSFGMLFIIGTAVAVKGSG